MKKGAQASIEKQYDVIIVGGGLAGLTCAIHLSRHSFSILIIEKKSYPAHKVCGEYVSREVLPYLRSLGIDPLQLGAKSIRQLEVSTVRGETVRAELPLGGFGISRYLLDATLAEKAVEHGAVICKDTVTGINFIKDEFLVSTQSHDLLKSKIAIGAFGKRSGLDINMNRKFIQQRSPFLAVKTHAEGTFPEHIVALHNFKGGYCGVSCVENGDINLCYITDLKAFSKYRDIDEFQRKVVFKNKHLHSIFTDSQPVFEKPLSISQISFAPKKAVENHVLMCGDTAGLIHPLCGNGMSMAIRSARIASELVEQFLKGVVRSRSQLEQAYRKAWNREFKSRLRAGQAISILFNSIVLSELSMLVVRLFPGLLPKIIQMTHGKSMQEL